MAHRCPICGAHADWQAECRGWKTAHPRVSMVPIESASPAESDGPVDVVVDARALAALVEDFRAEVTFLAAEVRRGVEYTAATEALIAALNARPVPGAEATDCH